MPAGRREQMHGVAAEQDAALPEFLRDQREAGVPARAADDLDIERHGESLVKHRDGLRVGNPAGAHVRLDLGVERELVAAVHRRHEGAALVVDRPVHPGARMRQHVVELRARGNGSANIRPPMKSRTAPVSPS